MGFPRNICNFQGLKNRVERGFPIMPNSEPKKSTKLSHEIIAFKFGRLRQEGNGMFPLATLLTGTDGCTQQNSIQAISCINSPGDLQKMWGRNAQLGEWLKLIPLIATSSVPTHHPCPTSIAPYGHKINRSNTKAGQKSIQ